MAAVRAPQLVLPYHPPAYAAPWPRVYGKARILLLCCVLCTALAARVGHLSASGFAEDEIDKLRAAEAYSQGDFAFDGEHPALMKLAVFASVRLAALAPAMSLPAVPIETAVRFPNTLAGALIVVLLFLLVERLFDQPTALAASLLWAFDPGAAAINRIAKEDTFVLFFLLLAAYFYERGKARGRLDPRGAQRWFTAAGAAFGLMMASKYMPYFFGLHVVFAVAADPHPGKNRPDKLPYFGAMAAAFLAANFPLLLPANLHTIRTFVEEGAVAHTGYLFQGRIWPNTMSSTPWGLPGWFYAAELVTKMPLPVLAAFGVGAWQLFRRRSERGAVFVRVFLLFTLVPYSLVATKFIRYMEPTLAFIDIAAAVGLVWFVRRICDLTGSKVLAAATAGSIVLATAVAGTASEPFPGLYRNALGTRWSPHQLWFPPDELYDAGMREAVQRLSREAGARARVVTEAPGVARHYARVFGRDDMAIGRTLASVPGETWLLVQDGRLYLENVAMVNDIRRQYAPVFQIDVHGFRAVQAFRLR